MKRGLFGAAVPLLAALCLGLAPGTSAGAASSAATRAGVTPLQQVLQLINGLLSRGKQEKHEEEVEFARFQQWCSGTRAALTKSIADGGKQIDELTAEIAKAKADAEVLAKEVADLQAATAKATEEAESATAQRETERADYEAQLQDFTESITACKRAIEVLKARSADVPQSLIQVRRLRLVPAAAKAALGSFLQLREGTVEPEGAPLANAYEFQSGGVVAILEKLTLDFEDQRLALEKAEMTAKANAELLLQQLTDNVRSYKDGAAKKTALKASRQERAAAATGELQAVQAAKAQDEKALQDTLAECAARSASFEKDQVTRSEEIKALEEAAAILSSGSVAGNAETYLPQLLQTGARTALAQLRSQVRSPPQDAARQKVTEFLQARAGALQSRYLALVAARAAEDPFARVISMIKELITKLTEQANAEADHHAYCTSELATNKMTREDKSAEVEELNAKLDQLTAESARLAGEIASLSQALSELRQQQAEATRLRNEERTANAKTVADAREAQTAVAKATQVLKDFYGRAAEASMLQANRDAAPYRGQQSGSTGVFGLLEVILSDFARLEASTVSAEDQAAAAHERFMAETSENVAVKETTLEHEQAAKRQADEKALATKKELDLTQEELDRALEYYDKLKADCIDTGLSYEDRVKARQEEVQSLREALAMLSQQDLA